LWFSVSIIYAFLCWIDLLRNYCSSFSKTFCFCFSTSCFKLHSNLHNVVGHCT
jgi:hypothetical protein